jgi:hypothetical protein
LASIDRRDFVVSAAALGAGAALSGCATAGTAQAPVPTYADPLFNQPYIDVDEWRDTPSRHRYVHGGFTGTEAKFLILLPPAEKYQGRFFQHNTAIPVSELEAGNWFGGDFAGFCFDSGAAAVVTNQGGFSNVPQHGQAGPDPNIGSYRVAAATAMYTRVLANEMYGAHRCYGYAFGGSGGAYRTLACVEHTDAWEGCVPYIHGNMQAWPNNYAGRARAQRNLKPKFPQIVDALEPGGSGDMYASLNEEERGILTEVTRLGFPPRTWVFHDAMGIGPLTVVFQGIQTLDPTYFEEFWTTPGYLGHDQPQAFANVRVQHRARVTRIIMSDQAAASGLPSPRWGSADPDQAWRQFQSDFGAPIPVALELSSAPPAGSFLDMANIVVASGESNGKWIQFGGFEGRIAKFQFSPAGGSFKDITDHIRPGDEVVIDNSNILAYETYYRHALLTPDYYVGNQFRNADGTPIYPQRPRLIAEDLMRGASPTQPTGRFNCKMIVVQNLLDWDAQPWYADFYRTQVRENLGARFGDNYRLWYFDHYTHGAIPDPTRATPYNGALQQALRDVAAWAERGVAPPHETNYRVEEGQVVVPATANERRGVQPVVTVQANGAARADVRVGQPVDFTAILEAPSGTGSIVAAEWDFDATEQVGEADFSRRALVEQMGPHDSGRFAVAEQFNPAPRIALTRSHAFTQPGTYFPALRVYSQRQGDAATPYARVSNLGRVRVVVT